MDIIVISLLTVLPCLCNAGSTDNLALGANAVQSSTYNELADANHAVDGNRESNYGRGSCTHTGVEDNPWWRVDLKGIYSINKVIITNRGDCCEERIAGAQIRIGNSLDNNGNNNKLAATIGSIPLGGTQTFTFDNIQGQYVNIFLPGTQKVLTLCEVEVYSDNIAFGGKAVQSSTYNELADADHAVDGNRDSDYMKRSSNHTAIEKNHWRRVHLKRIYSINKVIITNRGDCCGERIIGAQIRIGNSLYNNRNNNKL
ncbi:fucolectin [Misgurnus anguillicaudatus]|uniref:fucolectin n=1 Tax=Misgurnus anguillicaudatus TaxID=75329 RepID=UPI003CCF81E4